jgi:4'-phosphopantetheinyl transferase EntD
LLFPEEELERELSRVCAVPIKVAVVESKLAPEDLTQGERSILSSLRHERRHTSWLTGRAALKRLLHKMERNLETATMKFPNPEVSLSHSGEVAVAVSSEMKLAGIGVDIELRRPLRPAMARFFLRAKELPYVEALTNDVKETELLRLWTVKEALFKADCHNAGRGLKDYELVNPADRSGTAQIVDDGGILQYGSYETRFGVVSCAVRKEK